MVANEILVNVFYYYFGFLGFYFSAGFFACHKNDITNQMSKLKLRLD